MIPLPRGARWFVADAHRVAGLMQSPTVVSKLSDAELAVLAEAAASTASAARDERVRRDPTGQD